MEKEEHTRITRLGVKPLKRTHEENLTKIIRWEDGSLLCFNGTFEEAREYAREQEKKTGVKYAAIICLKGQHFIQK